MLLQFLHRTDGVAGQERFRTITSNYYRGSHGIIFGKKFFNSVLLTASAVYDVSSRASFESIEVNWLREAKEYFPNNEIVMMLVANKIDLGHRQVSKEEGEKFAMENGMMFIETSAKTKIGVQEAFEELVNKVMESPLASEVSMQER